MCLEVFSCILSTISKAFRHGHFVLTCWYENLQKVFGFEMSFGLWPSESTGSEGARREHVLEGTTSVSCKWHLEPGRHAIVSTTHLEIIRLEHAIAFWFNPEPSLCERYCAGEWGTSSLDSGKLNVKKKSRCNVSVSGLQSLTNSACSNTCCKGFWPEIIHASFGSRCYLKKDASTFIQRLAIFAPWWWSSAPWRSTGDLPGTHSNSMWRKVVGSFLSRVKQGGQSPESKQTKNRCII